VIDLVYLLLNRTQDTKIRVNNEEIQNDEKQTYGKAHCIEVLTLSSTLTSVMHLSV